MLRLSLPRMLICLACLYHSREEVHSDQDEVTGTNASAKKSDEKGENKEKDTEEVNVRTEEVGEIEDVMEDIFEDDWEKEVLSEYNSEGTGSNTSVQVHVDLDLVTVHSHLQGVSTCLTSFGMLTTFGQYGKKEESVTLTTSGPCVCCVTRKSLQNRPRNVLTSGSLARERETS